jgi:ketosteroid isomerase-like protein
MKGETMKGKTIIAVAASLLLLLLGLAMTGCGDEGPSRAAEDFVRASAELDCENLVGLLANDSIQLFGEDRDKAVEACNQELEAMGDQAPKLELTSFEITEENVDGDTADVKFKASAKIEGQEEEQTEEDTVHLVKEDGQWKVSVM